jgi:sporulation protein YlmC with PRC-barrel domain
MGTDSMADGGTDLIKLDDFEGELEEPWQDARGYRVIDKNGDEVGTVEELYIWASPSTVHLILVSGEERSFLIPVYVVTNADEEAVVLETGRDELLQSPEFESDDVPNSDARRAAFDYYGYTDPLDLGGG